MNSSDLALADPEATNWLAPLHSDAAAERVEEIQGLYGAFTFSEKLLQKIWSEREFSQANARCTDGRRVRIVHPGKWNFLGGPDFKGARLRLDDGPEITGDVELHLHAEGWREHGHARNPAYDDVMLHVVLFPPAPGHTTVARNGTAIPVLALLPLLDQDLEAFAAEEAVTALANRPATRIDEELGPLPKEELDQRLREWGRRRWQQKVRFARSRLAKLGWEAACHHAALEILGYRFNRAPMLQLASARPLARWREHDILALESGEGPPLGWSLHGVRPANHPLARLRQYAAWVRANPDWPADLLALGPGLPNPATERPTGGVRRDGEFSRWRRHLAESACAGAVGGTRLDNLVCDGFLPLLAAADAAAVEGAWFHWYPGDLPPLLPQALRRLGAVGDRAQPICHGLGQGLLGWLLERESQSPAARGTGA